MRLKDGDRLPFVTKHIADAAPAVLQGPAFLSGLTQAEIEIVRRQYKTKVNPELAEAKAKATDALAHCKPVGATPRTRFEVGQDWISSATAEAWPPHEI